MQSFIDPRHRLELLDIMAPLPPCAVATTHGTAADPDRSKWQQSLENLRLSKQASGRSWIVTVKVNERSVYSIGRFSRPRLSYNIMTVMNNCTTRMTVTKWTTTYLLYMRRIYPYAKSDRRNCSAPLYAICDTLKQCYNHKHVR